MAPGSQNDATLSQLISSINGDFSKLGNLIKTYPRPISASTKDVTIRAHYLPFRSGQPMVGELIDVIRGFIVNFALPKAEINEAHQKAAGENDQERLLTYISLRDTAADLFIKAQKATGRSGECGELLLFLLLEWVVEAPQIIAKMALKTNGQMPVHGSDGIHIKYDDQTNTLLFFWGEAKLHASISSGLERAITSISEAIQYGKMTTDINLVKRYFDLSGLPAASKAPILEHLDPLSPSYGSKLDVSACLIGFNFAKFGKLANEEKIEDAFCEFLGEELSDAVNRLEATLKAKGISHHRMEFFFLPVPSVEDLRKDFQNRIGWVT